MKKLSPCGCTQEVLLCCRGCTCPETEPPGGLRAPPLDRVGGVTEHCAFPTMLLTGTKRVDPFGAILSDALSRRHLLCRYARSGATSELNRSTESRGSTIHASPIRSCRWRITSAIRCGSPTST